MKVNKDDKVVDKLYEENQNLYTRLGVVYDNEIMFLAKVIDNSKDENIKQQCRDEIERLQNEIEK